MSLKILYVTSTVVEAEALEKIRGSINIPGRDQSSKKEICLLISGVGSMSTAWSLNQWISENGRPDLAINGGIAGSYRDEFKTGDVVMPVSDCFADAGIEDGNKFLTLAEIGLMSGDEFPYKDGLLHADPQYLEKMKKIINPVRAITVNTATGSETSRERWMKKYYPDIETMEGATFFYLCLRENIPFLAIRAISNKVELRNKDNWNISLALKNLSEKLIEVLLTL
jgi:futalosine hydrolase